MFRTMKSMLLLALCLSLTTRSAMAGTVAFDKSAGGVNDDVFRFDTSGNPLSSFDPVGIGVVIDVDFDSTTGNLYGVNIDTDNNENTFFLATWAQDGTLLSNTSLGVASGPDNSASGATISVNTIIPEPSSLILPIVFSGTCLLRRVRT